MACRILGRKRFGGVPVWFGSDRAGAVRGRSLMCRRQMHCGHIRRVITYSAPPPPPHPVDASGGSLTRVRRALVRDAPPKYQRAAGSGVSCPRGALIFRWVVDCVLGQGVTITVMGGDGRFRLCS